MVSIPTLRLALKRITNFARWLSLPAWLIDVRNAVLLLALLIALAVLA